MVSLSKVSKSIRVSKSLSQLYCMNWNIICVIQRQSATASFPNSILQPVFHLTLTVSICLLSPVCCEHFLSSIPQACFPALLSFTYPLSHIASSSSSPLSKRLNSIFFSFFFFPPFFPFECWKHLLFGIRFNKCRLQNCARRRKEAGMREKKEGKVWK